jgi:hypothetical protein
MGGAVCPEVAAARPTPHWRRRPPYGRAGTPTPDPRPGLVAGTCQQVTRATAQRLAGGLVPRAGLEERLRARLGRRLLAVFFAGFLAADTFFAGAFSAEPSAGAFSPTPSWRAAPGSTLWPASSSRAGRQSSSGPRRPLPRPRRRRRRVSRWSSWRWPFWWGLLRRRLLRRGSSQAPGCEAPPLQAPPVAGAFGAGAFFAAGFVAGAFFGLLAAGAAALEAPVSPASRWGPAFGEAVGNTPSRRLRVRAAR